LALEIFTLRIVSFSSTHRNASRPTYPRKPASTEGPRMESHANQCV
jgi:hypothetical protein